MFGSFLASVCIPVPPEKCKLAFLLFLQLDIDFVVGSLLFMLRFVFVFCSFVVVLSLFLDVVFV